MEKARSLLEAEANLDEIDDEPGDPSGPRDSLGAGAPPRASSARVSPSPSGVVPARAPSMMVFHTGAATSEPVRL